MNKNDKRLDELFHKARTQAPIASFEETSARLFGTIATGGTAISERLFSNLNIIIKSLLFVSALTIIAFSFFNNNESIKNEASESSIYSSEKNVSQNKIAQESSQNNLPLNDNINENTAISVKLKLNETPKLTVTEVSDISIIDTSELIQPETNIVQPITNHSSILEERTEVFLDTTETNIVEPAVSKEKVIQFTVNELTPTWELASISNQARQAGIDYTYVVDLKKKLIREFNVEMFILGTDISSKINISVPKQQKFTVNFGWTLNEKGKAIELSESVNIIRAEQKHALHGTVEVEIKKIYLEHGIVYLEQNFEKLTKKNKWWKSNWWKKDWWKYKRWRNKENILNKVGYLFINENAITDAIEIFKLNTNFFPDRPNPWDSLGEAYYKNGDKQNALIAFRKALSIDPDFSSSQYWVNKIMSEQ